MNKLYLILISIFLSAHSLLGQVKEKKISLQIFSVLTSSFNDNSEFAVQTNSKTGYGINLKYDTSPNKNISFQLGLGVNNKKFINEVNGLVFGVDIDATTGLGVEGFSSRQTTGVYGKYKKVYENEAR